MHTNSCFYEEILGISIRIDYMFISIGFIACIAGIVSYHLIMKFTGGVSKILDNHNDDN